MTPDVVIIGCGFLGEAAAALFSARGARVLGLVRSAESLAALADASFETARCDVADDASVEALARKLCGVPLAIHAVSAGGGGAGEYASLYRDGLKKVVASWQPRRVIFVSSTSVYGQDDGSWITEESPTEPPRETGRILLEAERIALDAGGIAARLTGIYGPGRSYLLRNFLSGEAVLENGGGRWINQIHRNDGAAALVRLGDPEVSPGVYNVTDDTPATQREVYGWMADFFGRPLPPSGPPGLALRRGVTSKRISNAKLRGLDWAPAYPSYRDALPLLASEI
jgi:nucleoside-diphosphate-sugar epimerase